MRESEKVGLSSHLLFRILGGEPLAGAAMSKQWNWADTGPERVALASHSLLGDGLESRRPMSKRVLLYGTQGY